MPLIPLWQLDYHIAYSRELGLPPIDPLRVFCHYGRLEDWRKMSALAAIQRQKITRVVKMVGLHWLERPSINVSTTLRELLCHFKHLFWIVR